LVLESLCLPLARLTCRIRSAPRVEVILSGSETETGSEEDEEGSGNVLADMGLENAVELLAHSKRGYHLCKFLKVKSSNKARSLHRWAYISSDRVWPPIHRIDALEAL